MLHEGIRHLDLSLPEPRFADKYSTDGTVLDVTPAVMSFFGDGHQLEDRQEPVYLKLISSQHEASYLRAEMMGLDPTGFDRLPDLKPSRFNSTAWNIRIVAIRKRNLSPAGFIDYSVKLSTHGDTSYGLTMHMKAGVWVISPLRHRQIGRALLCGVNMLNQIAFTDLVRQVRTSGRQVDLGFIVHNDILTTGGQRISEIFHDHVTNVKADFEAGYYEFSLDNPSGVRPAICGMNVVETRVAD